MDKMIFGALVGFNHLGSDTGAEIFVMKESGAVVKFGCRVDPDDGYRSWTCIWEQPSSLEIAKAEVSTADYERFLAEPILVSVIIENGKFYDALTVRELNGEEFIKVYTDTYDDYYPMACIEYHPERLSVNVNKEN